MKFQKNMFDLVGSQKNANIVKRETPKGYQLRKLQNIFIEIANFQNKLNANSIRLQISANSVLTYSLYFIIHDIDPPFHYFLC